MTDVRDPIVEARRLLNGYRAFQCMVAACRLMIPDLVSDGPKTAAELAAVTQTHAPSLRRLMRGLVAWRVFTEDVDGRFHPTAVSAQFRADKPGMRQMLVMIGEEGYSAWADVMYTLRTGKPAFEHVFGMSRWEKMAQDPEGAAAFNAAMVETTTRVARAFIAGYQFDGVRTIVDVGGGNGALLAAVLEAQPETSGVLFDLAAGLQGGRERFASAGLDGRVEMVEGSFFESIPAGADLYLLKSIVHDWAEEHARAILVRCREAMQPASRMVLLERTLPARIDDPDAALATVMSDLHMMVVLGGRERTPAEYGELLATAGLRMTRHIPFDQEFGAVEAVIA